MQYKIYSCSILICFLCFEPTFCLVGKFLHVSDFHFDVDFSVHGFKNYYCHVYQNGTENKNSISPFGNYLCDSPYGLVESAIQNMAKFLPEPDFVLWTGDSAAHVPDSLSSTSKVIKAIENVTDTLKKYFPTSTIYPVLGNHDYWPANQFGGEPNAFYNATADMWKSWLTTAAYESMRQYGYYTMNIGQTVQLLALNTNLYMSSVNQAVTTDDPGDQFRYIEKQLLSARKSSKKVWILAHIPPGPGYYNFGDCYNERFLKLMREYNDVIFAGFYGHDHIDEFRLLSQSESNQTFINFFLVAPSVTAWDGLDNPSFRIIDYDTTSYDITDVTQIYLNLADAITTNEAKWVKEYSYKENYGLNIVSTETLGHLFAKMKNGESNYRELYTKFRSVLYPKDCNESCQQQNLCEIGYQDKKTYDNCVQEVQHSAASMQIYGFLQFLVVICYFSSFVE